MVLPNAKEIGTFELKSGLMGVGDPCHDGSSSTFDALNGEWRVVVEYSTTKWGRRVKSLLVSNTEGRPVGSYEKIGLVHVDSGQAGFFDSEIEDLLSEQYYDEICDITGTTNQGGSIGRGAFSSTGYGDGSYDVSVRRDANGKVTEAVIDYVLEEN